MQSRICVNIVLMKAATPIDQAKEEEKQKESKVATNLRKNSNLKV